jgi:hypothetical protein
MALASSTVAMLAMAAAAAGTAYNTSRTARRQDSAAADSIRNQSRIQRRADERVDQEVQELEGSTAADERQQRLGEYMQTLRAGEGGLTAGLTPAIGSDAFRADSATAAGEVKDYAAKNAGLMSRIDAAQMQRQGEGFGYGRLATDIGMIGRESRGQDFMDQLRMRSIVRNPWIDAGAQVLGGMAGGMGGGAPANPRASSHYGTAI